MGDRCFVRIRIGGEITPAGIEALLAANDEVQLEKETIECAIEKGDYLDVEVEEVNWGNVDSIEQACIDHNLTISVYNGEGGSYGPGLRYWKPGMPESISRELMFDGGQAITLETIHRITEKETSKAKKFDAVMRWLKESFDVPPLTLATREKKSGGEQHP